MKLYTFVKIEIFLYFFMIFSEIAYTLAVMERYAVLVFLTSIFEPLYFLKSCPIFDELALPVFSKYNGFLWLYWFLAKKSCFLGPTIFRIPQPNWYCTLDPNNNKFFFRGVIKLLIKRRYYHSLCSLLPPSWCLFSSTNCD